MTTAEIIKKLREARGWNRRQLAVRAGVNVRAIEAYEAEDVKPTLLPAARIAEALGVTVDDLVPRDAETAS